MKKIKIYSEAVYFIGIALIAFGAAFMEKAGFGLSMVVAPAYLVYMKLSQFWSFFTFGMAEYLLQAVLLVGMVAVIKRMRISYLVSFITALLYGFILDSSMAAIAFIPSDAMWVRILLYIAGLLLTSFGVSTMFKTYISPEVYELLVKEICGKFKISIPKFKTAYDCISCVFSIAMSFAFFGFGKFVGINIGTVICALVNGKLIGVFSDFLDKKFEFKDKFKFRHLFE